VNARRGPPTGPFRCHQSGSVADRTPVRPGVATDVLSWTYDLHRPGDSRTIPRGSPDPIPPCVGRGGGPRTRRRARVPQAGQDWLPSLANATWRRKELCSCRPGGDQLDCGGPPRERYSEADDSSGIAPGDAMDFPIAELMDPDACYAELVEWLHPDGLAFPRRREGDRIRVQRGRRPPVLDYRCGHRGRVFNTLHRHGVARRQAGARPAGPDGPRVRPGRNHRAARPRAEVRPLRAPESEAPAPGPGVPQPRPDASSAVPARANDA
jgi:hypothetical protein